MRNDLTAFLLNFAKLSDNQLRSRRASPLSGEGMEVGAEPRHSIIEGSVMGDILPGQGARVAAGSKVDFDLSIRMLMHQLAPVFIAPAVTDSYYRHARIIFAPPVVLHLHRAFNSPVQTVRDGRLRAYRPGRRH